MTEPYRDEIPALEEQLRQLRADLEHIDHTATRRGQVADHIRDLERRLAAAKKRGPLENVQIATPCHAKWEDMTGDDRVRHCHACNKSVFNVENLTRAEALELLGASPDGQVCLRLYRRADGTVMTADCAVGVRAKKVRRLVVLGAGLAAAATAVGGLWNVMTSDGSPCELKASPEKDRQPYVMGSTTGAYLTGTAAPINPTTAPTTNPKR
ncbi:MAG: hypothetical protein U0271_16855 [Polyangiaceae bacterium]